ncbi:MULTISPECIES: hypothetical protein [Actinosynnema]|uniref:hypothetical protein n=1 Tax=Actinosynnema TaxID=40566 RepID=UPI0020A4A7FD|nr:hypothetical protein [Actinosynnema pretiosum]MCP2099467.1 hypothetical protein [Actinosynnema pretiosum]
MPTALTAPAVLRAAVECGAVPSDAVISRSGDARWVARGLAHHAWITRAAGEVLSWGISVGDAEHAAVMEPYGGIAVLVRGDGGAVAWPGGVGAELALVVRGTLGRAAGLVADRVELCALLASLGDVRRDGLRVWLPASNYPARLVKALVLARAAGDLGMEERIIASLHRPPVVLDHGGTLDVLEAARHWAVRFAAVLGAPIPLDEVTGPTAR